MHGPWNIELSSDFETGAGIQLRSPEPGVVTFLAPWDTSPQPMWFHFRIRGAKGRRVRFVLKNARHCLGGEKPYAHLRVRPVITDDPPAFIASRRRWRRIRRDGLSYDASTGAFSFEANIHSDEAYIAHCYPYGLAEWREFLSDSRQSSSLTATSIGRTERDRSIPLVRISDGLTRGKKRIWLTARHHSGETPGSWALEGTLRWLLSRNKRAVQLRKRFLCCTVPMVDLDGVVEGRYGKERAPVDFNRAYMEDSARAEIRHILGAIFTRPADNLLMLDFHAPGPGDPHLVFAKSRPYVSERYERLLRRFAKILAKTSPPRSKLSPKNIVAPWYMADEAEVTSVGAMYAARGLLSATVEVSYGVTANGHVLTRKDYLDYGAAIGEALYEFLSTYPLEEIAEHDSERVPLAGYAGDEYHGAFLWAPPKDAALSCKADNKGEILKIRLSSKSGTCHLGMPRGNIGPKAKLLLRWRHMSKRGTCENRKAIVTVFYYGARGLRLRRDDKIHLDLRARGKWRERVIELNVPRGARTLRASINITGGPATFEIRPPLAM